MNALYDYIVRFRSGTDLAETEAASFLDLLITETDEENLRKLFLAWKAKGIAESELFGLAKIMRERCVPVRTSHTTFVDAVGTGGAKSKTFNVSTAAAFVIAGAGVPVAKHGNRAATSNSGAADVLAELGVDPAVDAATAGRCLDEVGICFMFAPNFHRLSPTLGKVRRGLGFPTIFNNLGPLCNPAGAPHQVVGVWSRDRLNQTAVALARLGTRLSWVVNGDDGLDEITLNGATSVAEIRNGEVQCLEVHPEDFGIRQQTTAHLKVHNAAESSKLIRGILDNSLNGAARDLVLLNAAAAIYLSGRREELSGAAAAARESIASGSALRKLQELAAATNA
ncbi:MAG TPA: anthranilate phosphoribosyltransferase [Pyrinomonadaceae bacterium]|nr:anthranilate phosphoribosyltransferase [Pyrinomonadaceae bacterium]